ncbi:MAG: hypothetical protein AAF772_10605, partial [Acidobacteriota bacterium]
LPPPRLGAPTLGAIAVTVALVTGQVFFPPKMNVIDAASLADDLSLTAAPAPDTGAGSDAAPRADGKRKRVRSGRTAVARTPAQEAAHARYVDDLGLGAQEAAVLASDDALIAWFNAGLTAAEGRTSAAALAKWTVHELLGRLDAPSAIAEAAFDGAALVALIELLEAETIAAPAAKEVLDVLVAEGGEPAAIVDARGLRRLADDDALDAIIDQVFDAHPAQLADYRGGKTALFGFFMGQVMKASSGRAAPQTVRTRLRARLDAS